MSKHLTFRILLHINNDGLVKSQKALVIVIPVKTGIQEDQSHRGRLPRSREICLVPVYPG